MATEQNISDAAQRALQAQGIARSLEDLERLIPFARRMLAEEQDDHFYQSYTIAITSGVGIVYNLSGSINVDLIWTFFGRAVHADGTEISLLPWGTSSRDLTYPRFTGYYYGVLESSANTVTITVMQGDGVTAAPNGNVVVDFATVRSLANWPTVLDTALVAKVVELATARAEAAA